MESGGATSGGRVMTRRLLRGWSSRCVVCKRQMGFEEFAQQDGGGKEWSRDHKIGFDDNFPFLPLLVWPVLSDRLCIYYDSSRYALLWLFFFALLWMEKGFISYFADRGALLWCQGSAVLDWHFWGWYWKFPLARWPAPRLSAFNLHSASSAATSYSPHLSFPSLHMSETELRWLVRKCSGPCWHKLRPLFLFLHLLVKFGTCLPITDLYWKFNHSV